MTLGSIAD